MIEDVVKELRQYRFTLDSEQALQQQIARVLPSFEREHRFDKKSRIDFFRPIDGIGMEVKIKGGRMAIYRQVERYSKFDSVTGLILITNVAMGFPKELNGKPCYVISLGERWL